MEDRRNFKKRYIFVSIVLIGLAVWYLALPEPYNNKELKPEQLLLEVIDDTRFVSTDEVASALINSDYITLVDVRSEAEYTAYHLPGAINIPAADLLAKDESGALKWEDALGQDIRKVILYGNGSIYASQAWTLLRRLKYDNIYVMKGGLNEWISTIILPKHPGETVADSELALYNTRKAASFYFTGGKAAAAPTTDAPAVTPAANPGKSGKKKEGGGC